MDWNENFLNAVEKNDFDAMSLALKNGAEINHINDNEESPLMVAAHNGYHESVKWLLEHGADVMLLNEYGKNVLFYAAESEHDNAEIVRFLLEKMEKNAINHVSRSGDTPLLTALFSKNYSCARTLVELGADLDKWNCEGTSAITALIESAFMEEDFDMIQFLLDNGAELNKDTTSGPPHPILPLAESIIQMNRAVTEMFLDHGADVNARDAYGHSMFWVACNTGLSECAELLLKMGADIEEKGECGDKSIVSCVRGFNIHPELRGTEDGGKMLLEVVKMLLSHGENLETRSKEGGSTVLMAAAEGAYPYPNLISGLIALGADITAKNNLGQNPLMHALRTNGNPEHIKILMESGISLEETDNEGMTALHHAVSSNNLLAVQELLKKGGNIHARDKCDRTPFLCAAERLGNSNESVTSFLDDLIGNRGCNDALTLKIAKILIEHGASLTDADCNGKNAYFYAALKGNIHFFDLLCSYKYPSVETAALMADAINESRGENRKQSTALAFQELMSTLTLYSLYPQKCPQLADTISGEYWLFDFIGTMFKSKNNEFYTSAFSIESPVVLSKPKFRGSADFLEFVLETKKEMPLYMFHQSPEAMNRLIDILIETLEENPKTVLRFLRKAKGLDLDEWVSEGAQNVDVLLSRLVAFTPCKNKDSINTDISTQNLDF